MTHKQIFERLLNGEKLKFDEFRHIKLDEHGWVVDEERTYALDKLEEFEASERELKYGCK